MHPWIGVLSFATAASSPASGSVSPPLSAGSGASDGHLALLLCLSAVGSLLVFTLAASAFRRRRSVPYLLITAALGALVLRPIVGTCTILGYVPMDIHHTLEHLLDVLIALLLLAAVVTVGGLERSGGPRPSKPEEYE